MNNEQNENFKLQNIELSNNIKSLLRDSDSFIIKNFKHLKISDYSYKIDEAIKELFLDENIVCGLIEDYIIQILKSKIDFYKYIDELKEDSLNGKILDYTKIKDLAHKNLGVARNLHIEDAQILLKEIMNKENLDYLKLCAKALEISVIKLNPQFAYETLKLIEVKDSL
ncbi:MAG: hypothetical protein A2513_03685 [Sulfurimonas sp. RIFOXYD12_FULL_33_39]|uniref:hypothetical protein n=1 Tax=unclassified Sulfurimonas TaxID=2623549 RepID=UPI0008AFD306|nr:MULTISPECIES: hypothetical protein [unclassified Sulfurimonas]OHE09241.1 MAG: hypothetical protein A2513_03685 [Sulfurimonas sp. RIFOXYD12_FULL_33_39]OHE12976.1 MAG: hypothetical protein A2530_05120 [Sulfurimonas sp. RIFOXYD2_FULL_34_21]